MPDHNIDIVYLPNKASINQIDARPTSVTLVLVRDKWNDFGSNTLFQTQIMRGGNRTELGELRLMIEGQADTSAFLEPRRLGSERLLDIGEKYLSLGGYGYYSRLVSVMPEPDLRNKLLAELHDVIYLEMQNENDPNLDLRSDSTFGNSLLRASDFVRAYGNARKDLLFADLDPHKFDFTLRFQLSGFTARHSLPFCFAPAQAFPSNIQVVIGKNGTGKTQSLYHLIDGLLGRNGRRSEITKMSEESLEIEAIPPFRHIVAVSFSPFEKLPMADNLTATENAHYTYCGLRSSEGPIDLDAARRKSIDTIVSILQHDKKNLHGHIRNERPKYPILLRVLRELYGDANGIRILLKFVSDAVVPQLFENCQTSDGSAMYLDVEEAIAFDPNAEEIRRTISSGLIENTIVLETKADNYVSHFSAGQEMFMFVVFATVANIRRESLIVLDEPELHLHPNIEVSYLRMLGVMLDMFESYAIIATHSSLIAREVPASKVLVIRTGDPVSPLVGRPSIETFGADLSKIANAVFDDVLVKKPFEIWLGNLISETNLNETTFIDLVDKYGDILNIESLAFLRNLLLTRQEKEGPDA